MPGYINGADSIKAKGIQEIACVAVNDPFVMAAWGERHNVGDKVRTAALILVRLVEKTHVEL